MITAANVIKPPMWCPGRNGHPLWRGCVGYWPLWDSVGTNAMDLSGYNNHGTLTNMDPPTDWLIGNLGLHLEFDGSDDTIDITGVTVAPPHTVALWVKPTSPQPNADSYLFDSQTGRIIIGCRVGSVNTLQYYDGAWRNTGVNIVDGNWHHIAAVTPVSGNVSMFLDGNLYSIAVSKHSNIGGTVRIAWRYAPSASAFLGAVSSAAIWGRALEPGPIAELAADPFCMIRPVAG